VICTGNLRDCVVCVKQSIPSQCVLHWLGIDCFTHTTQSRDDWKPRIWHCKIRGFQSSRHKVNSSHSQVTQSSRHMVNSSHGQLVTQSSHHTVNSSHSQVVTQSSHHMVNSSHGQLVTQSTRHTVKSSQGQLIIRSTRHTVKSSHGQVITQSSHTVKSRSFTKPSLVRCWYSCT